MATLVRVSYLDHRGFVAQEWFPTAFTANDRVNELATLGMEGIDYEDVEVPWDNLSDLIHWLNNNPNSPYVKDSAMLGPTSSEPISTPAPVPSFSAVTAPAMLNKAATLLAERGREYDKPEGERSMAQTVDIFNRFHGTTLTEAQGWHFMQVLKDVRLFQRPGYHSDSAEDCTAYSALKAEAKAKEA